MYIYIIYDVLEQGYVGHEGRRRIGIMIVIIITILIFKRQKLCTCEHVSDARTCAGIGCAPLRPVLLAPIATFQGLHWPWWHLGVHWKSRGGQP